MTFVLAKIETCSSASELLKSVNVLHAIRWVGEAWKNVKVITIKKCFRKCGVLRKDFSIVQPVITAQTDPFADIDEENECEVDEQELSELILSLQGPENACSLSELLTAESDIPVCSEFADLTWDDEFMAELGPQSKQQCSDVEDKDKDDSDPAEDHEPSPPHVKNYREAMECLEDVRSFF